MSVLEIQQLNKSFGKQTVLNGLDMTVPVHGVFGFIGQNGAGKTTTMKIALGLTPADSGVITVCGEKVVYGETKTNRHIGYLPDVPAFYGFMNADEYLRLCGAITGLTPARTKARSTALLSLVGLKGEKKRISGYSRGMKQRLGIAQALLHEPPLLICDEPTSALDPLGRKDILDILASIKGNTTIIFSTHILSDVERICDRVALLHNGKLAVSGTLAEVRARYARNGFVVTFGSEAEAAALAAEADLQKRGLTASQDKNVVTLALTDRTEDVRFLIGLLARQQMTPLRFEVMEPTLESLFVEVVK